MVCYMNVIAQREFSIFKNISSVSSNLKCIKYLITVDF